jgi:transcriptional regulator with XRE-family HTH domain
MRLLAEARKQQDITMEELAERASVHRTYVGLLERGERQPTLVAVAALTEALGLSLSQVLAEAERETQDVADDEPDVELVPAPEVRVAKRECVGADDDLRRLTGMDAGAILSGIDDAYHTLDLMDEQLAQNGALPFAQLVELANLSSMLGNLVGAGIAKHSGGLYERSGPHKYQDLRSTSGGNHVEIKTALEGNRPKGHLAKAGVYLTFRYVLGERDGRYARGERGDTIYVWEVRVGELTEDDFDESNTPGDSGKTAVLKNEVFKAMERIYFDPECFPYARLDGPWGTT